MLIMVILMTLSPLVNEHTLFLACKWDLETVIWKVSWWSVPIKAL